MIYSTIHSLLRTTFPGMSSNLLPPPQSEGAMVVAELPGSRVMDSNRTTNTDFLVTHTSGSPKPLAKTWRDVVPVPTLMRRSYFIITICTSIFGFQKDQTLLAVGNLALNAALVACLESIAVLFLGLLYRARVLYWVETRVAHDTIERGDKVSDTLHVTAYACFLIACASLFAFLLQTMWYTRSHISFGMLSSVVLAGAFIVMICYRLM
ncbi:hypothetical protein BOTBODRAFT_188696 [Botryobasidium botryosum FD-172 SS1]|uniref:Uncharacterized protein n=1 Tax=Botryobasidium botryosum (strain FD-172 SS1) TaxID=930990 RepID=A0A067MC72_BOTB1|nr:hypothetical protein BOTBODRAFT_188696 [Botryobasidium botryosum FD-172 SS1]